MLSVTICVKVVCIQKIHCEKPLKTVDIMSQRGTQLTPLCFCCAAVGLCADLPSRPYLTVLVRKSAGSMDVRPYFSKYGHRVS